MSAGRARSRAEAGPTVAVLYSDGYRLAAVPGLSMLTKLHPFDVNKYERIAKRLVEQGHIKRKEFIDPGPLDQDDLSLVHSAAHLRRLADSGYIAGAIEIDQVAFVPRPMLELGLLEPMRRVTAGTVEAVPLALRRGIAINLGGGYHHAQPEVAHGFCLYADVPIAILKASRDGLVTKVLIVDLDAHHGDGHAEALRHSAEVKILDFYGADLFPMTVGPIWRGVPFERGSLGTEYLATLRRELPAALNALSPELVVYIAGVDSYERDPLTAGYFGLTREQILERDQFVFEEVRSASIPIVMVLAGGYGPLAWELQYETVAWVLHRFEDNTLL
jgi:histone deacetylase 11